MNNTNPSRHQRQLDIKENISEIFLLIKEHEEILVSPVNPDQKRNAKRRISELKELLATQEAELAQIEHNYTVVESNIDKSKQQTPINGELHRNLAEIKKELRDLKRGQGAIYQILTETRNQELQIIINLINQGNFKQEEMQQMLVVIQQTLSILQENQDRLSEDILDIIDSTNSALQSEIGLQGKLELTLPIIPLLLDYKVELSATDTIDFNNLMENARNWWKSLLAKIITENNNQKAQGLEGGKNSNSGNILKLPPNSLAEHHNNFLRVSSYLSVVESKVNQNATNVSFFIGAQEEFSTLTTYIDMFSDYLRATHDSAEHPLNDLARTKELAEIIASQTHAIASNIASSGDPTKQIHQVQRNLSTLLSLIDKTISWIEKTISK